MMNLKTKVFILYNLINAIRTMHSHLEVNPNLNDNMYNTNLNYIQNLLDILIKDCLPKEYALILNDIELIQAQDNSNYIKMINVYKKLIDLSQRIKDM